MKRSTVLAIFLYFAALSKKSSGRRFLSCWDGISSKLYEGTVSTTVNGYFCQYWDAQDPATLDFEYFDADFIDGSISKAKNYCRNPDPNDPSREPWCYTANGAEPCDVPLCSIIECSDFAESGAVADDILESIAVEDIVDTEAEELVLIKDNDYRPYCCGSIQEWKLWVANPGKVKLQVWREDPDTGEYVLGGENVFEYSDAQAASIHTETVEASKRIPVSAGDIIGIYSVDISIVPYSLNDLSLGNLHTITPEATVGDSLSLAGADDIGNREYAIGVIYGKNNVPYFPYASKEMSISEITTNGATILILTVNDDDQGDIDTLVITMDTTSDIFAFDDVTSTVVTKVDPPLAEGVYDLSFTVTDRCEATGHLTLYITVTKEPVKINNVPGQGTVSESQTTETFIFKVTFDSVGPHTCTILSYEPAVPTVNPYIIKNGIDVYLKDNANIRYSDTTSHVLNVSCTDSSTSDTGLVTVNIEPNAKPTFDNWLASKTIIASETTQGKVVVTTTITDTDPLTVAIESIDPASCPFLVNNLGEIYATEDLLLTELTQCRIKLSADDTYNKVTSPEISITITGVNTKPFFTNLAAVVPVTEGTLKNAVIFTVAYIDGNTDDNVRLSTVYNPATCENQYYLNPNTGEISATVLIDYETIAEKSCELTVVANDGKVNSDPGTVTLSVTDMDEPPILSPATSFRTTTKEVSANTELDPGINCADPEGKTVTLESLDCGGDSKFLSLDPVTKLVTLAPIDIDKDGLASKTISCTFICKDATSQTTTGSLEVEVADANDETPTFTQGAYSANIYTTQELGVVASVSATDGDSTAPNKLFSYSLTGSTKFSINPANGDISLIGDITTDTGITNYELTVTATDQGLPPLQSSVLVTVQVTELITTTTTTTTPGTGTTTTAGTVVATDSGGWLDNPVNKLWLAIAIIFLLCLLAGLAFLIYKLCLRKKCPCGRRKSVGTRTKENAVDSKNKNDAIRSKENGINNNNDTNKGTGDENDKARHHSKPDKVHYNKSNGHVSVLDLEEGRPGSGDSGINLSPTSKTSNVSLTGISIHPSEENVSGKSVADISETHENRRARLQRMLSKRLFKPWYPY